MRAGVGHDIVDMAINTEVLNAMDGVGEDLRDVRQAQVFTGVYDKDGNPVYARDMDLVLRSIVALGNLVEKTRPKGAGVAVNVGVQTNVNNGGTNGKGRSFEAMVREAEKRQRLELGAGDTVDPDEDEDEDADVIDAEVEEVAEENENVNEPLDDTVSEGS